jgi:hypothetical protein
VATGLATSFVGLVIAGLFLVLDPILFHGGDFGAEGVQHQIQGALILVVAAALGSG